MKLRKVIDDPAAMKLVKQGWVPMLQTGEVTDSSGKKHNFTIERLKKIAENYDPDYRKAPIVVGHPKSNGPAFGWLGKVAVAGNFLLALPEKVQDKFRQWVNTGALNTRSISLEGNNIRHLGFLGAALPACPGLGDVELSWDGITQLFGDGEMVTFEASSEEVIDFAVTVEPGTPEWELAWKFMELGRSLVGVREYIIEKEGVEVADRILPRYLIESATERPIAKPKPVLNYNQGANVTPEQIASLQQENARFKAYTKTIVVNGVSHMVPPEVEAAFTQATADLTASKSKLVEMEASITAAADAAWTKTRDDFVSGLVKNGQLLPAEVDGVKGMLDRDRTAGQGEFSEEKNTALKTTMDFLRKQPKKVHTKVVATGDAANGAAKSTHQEATELARLATDFQLAEEKAGRTVSFDQAVAHVSKSA